ncbi:MAG: hypothetical protein KAV82_11045, partial [Phycisphaerae bacterium]|nr:hypothetical protein [Phycisphaerae bacterium]
RLCVHEKSGIKITMASTSGQHSDEIVSLCSRLRQVTQPDPSAEVIRPRFNPERDRLLYEYRRMVMRHIREDARVNLAELEALARSVSEQAGIEPTQTPVGIDAFARLADSLTPINEIDPYADAESQEKWWYALHQFYLDGLALADRLLRTRRRGAERLWRRVPRWVKVPGLSCPGWTQAAVTVAELNFPNVFRLNPRDTYLPTVLFLLAHHVFPRKPWRLADLFDSTRGWVCRRGFERMAGVGSPGVSWSGVEHVRNEHLFNTRTWRTRHNLVIACAHRFGFLDTPLIQEMLRGIRLGVWADSSFYGPGVVKKMVRDRYSIIIRGHYHPSIKQSLADTVDVLVNARVPVAIMVDGGQPPVFYGQQINIKGGVRLAVKAAIRASAGTGRKTYVVPLSLNDPIGFVQGRQNTMRVKFHPPVLVDEQHKVRHPGSAGHTINSGDPLLNHLESLFLLETAHAGQGLPHPRIVAAARRRRQNQHREPLLKRLFQTSLPDLAKHGK